MTRPRIRFTVRTMMIAMVALACLAAAITAKLRSDRLMMAAYHRDRAAEFLRMSRDEAQVADRIEGKAPDPIVAFLAPDQNPAGHRSNALVYGERAKYHLFLRTRYEFAADRPWSAIEPDPPPPPP